jgi:putative copper resistance protein D
MILMGTDVGIAWVVRVVALSAIVIVTFAVQRHTASSHGVVAALAAIALATVAWSGHGAMDEGARRYPHLIADILHLFAAAVWVGALAAFAMLLRRAKTPSFDQLVGLSRALAGFAMVGTLIVVTLIVTGAVNYWLTVGLSLSPLVSSQYGLLLLAKLCLFFAMLGLAAANRYHLTPRLEQSIDRGDTRAAVKALRSSLVLETGAALLILLLVAWLGVLSPSAPL